jgi:type IV pilus assembly protein PilB
MLDIGIAPYLVASSLNLVMAQRLVRKICSSCIADYTPTAQELEKLGISQEDSKDIKFKKGLGCVHCDNTGYAGRSGIFEMLEVTADIRKLIFEGQNQDVIRDLALKNGMQSLHDAAIFKMKHGITTVNEVIKFTITD